MKERFDIIQKKDAIRKQIGLELALNDPSKIWALQRTALERSKQDKQGTVDTSELTA